MIRLALYQILLSVLLYAALSKRSYRLMVGPLPGETGKYFYENSTSAGTTLQHCLYCPDNAFENTASNILYQEPRCISKYPKNVSKGLADFERKQKKYPFCKIGEVPRCGSLSQIQITDKLSWWCSPGWSHVERSVYFSCAQVCQTTGDVARTYYCNENLQWVEVERNYVLCETDDSTNPFVICTAVMASVILLLLLVISVCLERLRRRRKHTKSSYISALVEAGKPLFDLDRTQKCQECLRKTYSSEKSYSSEDTVSTDEGNNADVNVETTRSVHGVTSCDVTSEKDSTAHSNRFENSHEHFDEQVRQPNTGNPRGKEHNRLSPVGVEYRTSDREQLCRGETCELNVGLGPKNASSERRQEPVGSVSISQVTEHRRTSDRPCLGEIQSGIYDDENDDKHNTDLKRVCSTRCFNDLTTSSPGDG